MKKIDGLGHRPDRHKAFTRELLAEAEDDELKFIVEEAAKDLNTPIALVSLVMEHIQYFKAHYGLPEDLNHSRGTDRDISFCQFVVNNQSPLMINDASRDSRLPQTVVEEHGIRAYLGMPITVNDTVVGSLCVLDTRPRTFTEEEQNNLRKLAGLVNIRLASLTQRRKRSDSSLIRDTAYPALEEIKKSLVPVKAALSSGYMSTVEIGTFLKMIEYALHNPGYFKDRATAMQKARTALEACQSHLYNMEVGIGDTEDALDALGHVFKPATTTLLSEIAISGRELARYSLAKSGGAFLPDLNYDPLISIPRQMGVSLVATTLSMLSGALQREGLIEKLRMDSVQMGSSVALIIQCEKLSQESIDEVVLTQKNHTGEDPAVGITASGSIINLVFSVVQVRGD